MSRVTASPVAVGDNEPCRACIRQQLTSHRATHKSHSNGAVHPIQHTLYDENDEGEEEPHVRSCTYTSQLAPLDPAASCALQQRMLAPMGILSISFSGCGSFYPYMYGIGCYLQDHYDLSQVHFLATSGGCLPAVALATGLDIRESFFERFNTPVLKKSAARMMGAYLNFVTLCGEQAHEYFEDDIYLRANGRLHLSTSRLQLKPARGWSLWNTARAFAGGVRLLQNQRTSEWTSKADLIDNVAAACHIPILVDPIQGGLFKSWRGEWHLDGGLTDNQPVLDSDTITLQPFMWQSEASLLLKMSFIHIRLSPVWHAKLFEQGYKHAAANAEKVFARLPKRRGPSETRPIVPEDLAELIRLAEKQPLAAASDAAETATTTTSAIQLDASAV